MMDNPLKTIDAAIRAKNDLALTLRLSLLPASPAYNGRVQREITDPLSTVAAKLDRVQREIAALWIRRGLAVIELAEMFEPLEEEQRLVMTAFYINGDKAGKIARRIGRSLSTVYQILEDAERETLRRASLTTQKET